MNGAGWTSRRVARVLLAGGLAVGNGVGSSASEPVPDAGAWPRVQIQDPLTGWSVRWALTGASLLLADERCQAIFSDFRDQRGRPLHEKLTELDRTGQGYLELIYFMDGSSLRLCQDSHALAITAPGSRVVFVCGRRFVNAGAESSTHTRATVVHEALHSLGLGENPPSSRDITYQVLRRCR